MTTIGSMLAASAELGTGYARSLLTDITPEQFARFAKIGDTVIQSNHPAFILGHLSIYTGRVLTDLGLDDSAVQPTEANYKLFSHEAQCMDDTDGTIYPAMDEVTEIFFNNYAVAIEALKNTPDDPFREESANEALRERFPSKGAMLGFYVGGHVMLHLGQLSAWRRAAGLGSA